jgi:hypothetical protein
MIRCASLFVLLLVTPYLFAQGAMQTAKWNIGVWVASATGQEDRSSLFQAQVWTSGINLGRIITDEAGKSLVRGRLECGLNLVPIFASSGPKPIYGGGFEPIVLRWHFTHARHVVPYIEVAGGGVFTAGNFPSGDTSNFNFTTRGGGGMEIFTSSRQAWDIALQYLHMSNANLGNENPAFNGIQLKIGYHWYK